MLFSFDTSYMVPKLQCPTCGAQLRAQDKDCPSCGSFCWFPNVRKAEESEELTELGVRYDSAVAAAAERGRKAVFDAYESALAGSVAVVCRSLEKTKALLSSESAVYTTFYREISSGGRRAEETPIETQRVSTDARVFPFYEKNIRFAALSLDGRGVPSFGECSLVLKEISIFGRTSVFWENTVEFCNRVCPEQTKPIPLGYRAPWRLRARLGAAKGEPLLDRQSTHEEFSRILLDRDQFVEVHIYGPFNRHSFDRLLIPIPSKNYERTMVSAIRDIISR